jgi:hypothetical protein
VRLFYFLPLIEKMCFIEAEQTDSCLKRNSQVNTGIKKHQQFAGVFKVGLALIISCFLQPRQ